MSVRLTQLICENGHTLTALAWETDDPKLNADKVRRMIEAHLKNMKANPWCGLCGSTKLRYDDGELENFKTLAEALPHLRVWEKLSEIECALAARGTKPN